MGTGFQARGDEPRSSGLGRAGGFEGFPWAGVPSREPAGDRVQRVRQRGAGTAPSILDVRRLSLDGATAEPFAHPQNRFAVSPVARSPCPHRRSRRPPPSPPAPLGPVRNPVACPAAAHSAAPGRAWPCSRCRLLLAPAPRAAVPSLCGTRGRCSYGTLMPADPRWSRGGDAGAGERPQIQVQLHLPTSCRAAPPAPGHP